MVFDSCLFCGSPVPEGYQVCYVCSKDITNPKKISLKSFEPAVHEDLYKEGYEAGYKAGKQAAVETIALQNNVIENPAGSCEGCQHIAFRYPYASMYPCNNCVRANQKDYYNYPIKE